MHAQNHVPCLPSACCKKCVFFVTHDLPYGILVEAAQRGIMAFADQANADLLHGRLEPGHYRIRQACNNIKLPASYASPTRSALAPPPAATAPPAGRPCACTLDIGTTLPRISPTSSPDASQGARCGRRPTAARTARTRLEDKGSTKSNCSSTCLPTCEQHVEHSEQDSGHTSRACPDLTLLHSLARTRAAWDITNRRDAVLPRCMRARGIAHLRAL